MSPKFIFAILLAMFALNQSLAGPRKILKNGLIKDCYECDADSTFRENVNYLLQQGFTKYKSDYCRVSQYVADELRVYPGGEFIVLIGAHGVMGRKQDFAAQFDRVNNTYILTSYKGEHDVLVVKPSCEKPNIAVKGNGGSIRDLTEVITDMPVSLERQLGANIDNIFVENKLNYVKIANGIYEYVKKLCKGRWFVVVGPEMVLKNNDQLCGVAKKFKSTSFNATHEYRHSLYLFSPSCELD